jgi:hypothetical protein
MYVNLSMKRWANHDFDANGGFSLFAVDEAFVRSSHDSHAKTMAVCGEGKYRKAESPRDGPYSIWLSQPDCTTVNGSLLWITLSQA